MIFKNILIWGVLGSLISGLDEFHIYSGLMNHDNNWVMKWFPWWFSPNYFIGGIIFYLLFSSICENCNHTKFKSSTKRFISCLLLVSTYPISGFLCFYHNPNDIHFQAFNLIALAIFAFVIGWMKFEKHIANIIFYCFCCALVGLVFESSSSLNPDSGFYHQPCFGTKHWSCLGLPVTVYWLPFLYMNIALILPVFHLKE